MRKGWSYKLKLMLLPLVAVSTMGNRCDWFTTPYTITEQPPDECPWWDRDCDGISNAVETNGANSYLDLDTAVFDANPSIAHGWPCSTQCVGTECGWIENALNMVNTGTGYYHYNPEKIDRDDWGTLHLINMIEGTGRDWYNNRPPPRIGVGDLSWGDQNTQQFGGYWSDHICHQNGLEVDIRYVRNDGLEVGLNLGTADSIYFYVGATVALLNYLFNNSNPDKIYVSSYCRGKIVFTGIDTVYDATGGHDDHFHLRIQDPDGTGN